MSTVTKEIRVRRMVDMAQCDGCKVETPQNDEGVDFLDMGWKRIDGGHPERWDADLCPACWKRAAAAVGVVTE